MPPVIGNNQGTATQFVPQTGGGGPGTTETAIPTVVLGGSGQLPNKVPSVQAPVLQATEQLIPQTGEDQTQPAVQLAGLPLVQKASTYLGLLMLGLAFMLQGLSRRK
jgi:hypothetical protein